MQPESPLRLQETFKKFYLRYPFFSLDEVITNFAFLGGLESFLDLHKNEIAKLLQSNEFIETLEKEIPFFLLNEPYRRFLMVLAKSDGKYFSTLYKSAIGKEFGSDIIQELLELKILYKLPSREPPLKLYPKMAIKKEFKNYQIQDKFIFTKPFFRFYFGVIEPSKNKKGFINFTKLFQNFHVMQNRLSALIFEQLSQELLKLSFKDIDLVQNCYAYWDKFSEFDIYCEIEGKGFLVGECKFSNRPITKAELIKLQKKIEKSNLQANILAFFAKGGFSKELLKKRNSSLLLFELSDFKKLLL